jgi:hypothetical protein
MLTAVLVGASPATAAETIGSDVTVAADPGVALACPADMSCTYAQTGSATVGAMLPVRSPLNGVVVRWRVKGTGTLKLQVITSADGDTASATATSEPAASLDGTANPTRLPIALDQLVGVALDPGSSIFRHNEAGYGTRRQWIPALTSTPQAASGSAATSTAVLYNADVEADADRDVFGDETQDLCPGVAGPANGCPSPPATPGALTATTCKGKPATKVGTAGNDAIVGTAAPDVIAALAGNDKVSGLSGNDLICGGTGKDNLAGGKGKDKLLGQAGKDKLRGGGAKDICKGGEADDNAKGCEVEKSI